MFEHLNKFDYSDVIWALLHLQINNKDSNSA